MLVKCAKPGQELRADLPTIGPATVTAAHAAGLAGIGVEAGPLAGARLSPAWSKQADRLGLFVVGLPAGKIAMTAARPLKIAMVAGEESGDLLGADIVAALQAATGREVRLVGVGGRHLQALGLTPLFDANEIALMGFSAVIARPAAPDAGASARPRAPSPPRRRIA